MNKGISCLLGLLMLGCSPCIKVTRITDTVKPAPGKGYLYALPATELIVSLECTRTTYTQGPYSKFAMKYLGINVPGDSVRWTIRDVKAEPVTVADPDYYFVMTHNRRFSMAGLDQLLKSGLIIEPLAAAHPTPMLMNAALPEPMLSAAPGDEENNYEEVTDTLYKVILKDSLYVKMPVYKKRLVMKGTDVKAHEAADLISRIRERRIVLVTTDEEELPDGRSLEVVLKELNEMEAKYVGMFTGRKIEQSCTHTFRIVPAFRKGTDSIAVCSFSETDGVTENPESEEIRITLQVLSGKNDSIPVAFSLPDNQSVKNAVICRLPAKAKLQILKGDEVLREMIIPVSFGEQMVPVSARSLR